MTWTPRVARPSMWQNRVCQLLRRGWARGKGAAPLVLRSLPGAWLQGGRMTPSSLAGGAQVSSQPAQTPQPDIGIPPGS